MSKDTVADWDTTPSGNTDIAGIPLSDSTTITQIDNIVQNLMSQVRSGSVLTNSADAKGDILVASADNVVTRQPVGTNGKVLIADSSQTTGLLYAERGGFLSFSSGQQTQADGLTYFLGAAQIGTATGEIPFRSPAQGVLKNLFCQSTAASSGTRTFTLFKNGVATALTCFASGSATQCQDTTHEVAVGAGDYLEVRVVTSGGSSPAVKTNASVELFKTTA